MSLRVDTRPRVRNAPRPAVKSAPSYLKWLRGRPCWLADKGGCSGHMVAAHVDSVSLGKGMGTKVADMFAVPSCNGHHMEQHSRGWRTFQKKYGRSALEAAQAYWRAWPGRLSWERKLEEAQRA